MAEEQELDLRSLSDEELTQQMHDDLYDGLKEEIEDGVWSIYFARHLLARLDEHLAKIIEVPV